MEGHMRSVLSALSVIGIVVSFSNPVSAQKAEEDCTQTLIPATSNFNYNELQKLSLAWSISESEYNERKQNGSLNAVIYDVPTGANYSDFQKNILNKTSQLHIDSFQKRAIAYATSALTEENRNIFGMCEASKGGLYVAVAQIGSEAYKISIFYVPGMNSAFDVRGHLVQTQNINDKTAQVLSREIKAKNFGYKAVMEPLLVPQNRDQEAGVEVVVGQADKSVLLPPLNVTNVNLPKPTYHWKLIKTDDCGYADLAPCSEAKQDAPHEPDESQCTQARLNLSSVCWTQGSNRAYPIGPGFQACAGKDHWCTYKNASPDMCSHGPRPGNVYQCVYE
jgi:hypothetical protein